MERVSYRVSLVRFAAAAMLSAGCAKVSTEPTSANTPAPAVEASSPKPSPDESQQPPSAFKPKATETTECESYSAEDVEAAPSESIESRAKTADDERPAQGSDEPLGPSDALARATRFREEADRRRQEGRVGEAFQRATLAWEQVRRFPGDPECSRLADELIELIESIGEAGGEKQPPGDVTIE